MRHSFLCLLLLMCGATPIVCAQDIKDSLPPAPREFPIPCDTPQTPSLEWRNPVKTFRTYRMTNRTRRRVPGFRIQVYTGNNTRTSKQRALDLKVQIQKLFPELSVYIHFQSPRWICRAGDFISRAEARPYLQKIRRQRISPEASIVSCTVLRAY